MYDDVLLLFFGRDSLGGSRLCIDAGMPAIVSSILTPKPKNSASLIDGPLASIPPRM